MSSYITAENLAYYNTKINQVIKKGDSIVEPVTVELGENGTLGGYKTGDIIDSATPIATVIKKLLAKQIPPIYTAPTISLSNNGGTTPGNYEIGSIITPKVKAIYTQNDGGAITQIDILKNNTSMITKDVSPVNYEEIPQTLSAIVSFKAKVSYEEGGVKNDNLGEPYPQGKILAGLKESNTLSFNPYRQGYFWGVLNTSSVEAPLNSQIIRSGNAKNGAYGVGTITGITAAAVANRKRIFIACPADKKGVVKVIMPSAMNADCTTDFVKQSNTVLVEGANGYEGILYNVWVYEPAMISDDQTFTITLG